MKKNIGVPFEKIAAAQLGKQLVQEGFDAIEFGKEASGDSVVIHDMSEAWLMNNELGTDKGYINFSLSKDFKPEVDDGSVYELYFEYFDDGKGYFKIEYDALDNVCKKATLVNKKDTNMWQTARVSIADAAFRNRLDGKYDFRVGIFAISIASKTSKSSVAIRAVKVVRKAAKNPIRITASTDEPGNAFKFADENKIINLKYKNMTSRALSCTVTYQLEDAGRIKRFEKTGKLSIGADEEQEDILDIGCIKRSENYTLYANVLLDGEHTVNKIEIMTLAVMKTDPNGIRNEEVFWAGSPERFRWEIPFNTRDVQSQYVEMISRTNASGLRSESPQSMFEVEAGKFDWDKQISKPIAEELKKRNLKHISLLCNYSSHLTPEEYKSHYYYYWPRTDEALKNYSMYVEEVVKHQFEMGLDVVGYEINNEGNAASFNTTNNGTDKSGGELYVNMFRCAKEAIRKHDRDAIIMGPTNAGWLRREDAHYLAYSAAEAGLCKETDYISVHPYYWSTPETEMNMYNDAIEWRKIWEDHGGRAEGFITTETGFTRADGPVRNTWDQGAFLTRLLLRNKVDDLSRLTCIFRLEGPGEVPYDFEDAFGNFSPARAGLEQYGKIICPYESALMITAYNYLLADSEVAGRPLKCGENLVLNKLLSNKFKTDIVTLNGIIRSEQATVDLGTNEITYYDQLGNSEKLYSDDGIFTFDVKNALSYILGDINKVEFVPNGKPITFPGSEAVCSENGEFSLKYKKHTGSDYKIEVLTPDEIKLIGVVEFVEGEAELKFKNMLCSEQNGKIVVKFLQDGRLCSYQTVTLISK